MGDCQWFNSITEGYFNETLTAEELEGATDHLRTCLNCRNEVQAMRAIDPMVKQLFQFRMNQAHTTVMAPRQGMWFRLGLAGATLSMAGILMFVVLTHNTPKPETTDSVGPVAVENPTPVETVDGKSSPSPDILRAKPDGPETKVSPSIPAVEIPVPQNAPEFQVMDSAGYSRSLQDYRGRMLLVGVWSAEQPEAAENLQQLYQSLGARTDMRILGVSRRNQERPANTSFPVAFNNGSRLFDAKNSQYVLVDKEGKVQMRGDLTGDSKAISAKVKAELDQLGK